MDRPRTGYFGLLRNTHCPASLAGMIDLVGIDTARVEMNWLDALPSYNCHWIVRRRAKAHDGWKPFLKGFVAARCNAVVDHRPRRRRRAAVPRRRLSASTCAAPTRRRSRWT